MLGGRSEDHWLTSASQLWRKDEYGALDTFSFAQLEFVSGLLIDTLVRGARTKINIANHATFLDLYQRKNRRGAGLLTVSNHIHYLDDPILIALLLQGRYYVEALRVLLGDTVAFQNWKWTPAAKENFFHHPNPIVRAVFRFFFGRTKTVPIDRRGGLKQPAQQQLIKKLRAGDWVHVFIEGTRTRRFPHLMEQKLGPAQLIAQTDDLVVLPFGHVGIQDLSPLGVQFDVRDRVGTPTRAALRGKQRLQVCVGEPFRKEDIEADLHLKIPKGETEAYPEIARYVMGRVKASYSEALREWDANAYDEFSSVETQRGQA